MAQEPISGTAGQTTLSATPWEETAEYQNAFRNELPLRRCTNFFGAVPPGKTLTLLTYLGLSKGASPLRGLFMAGQRPDLENSLPTFGKARPSIAGRAVALEKAARGLKSLLDQPMDLPLHMAFDAAGSKTNAI